MLETTLLFLTSSKDKKNAWNPWLEIFTSPKPESSESFYGLKSLNDSKTMLKWSDSFFNELEPKSENYARLVRFIFNELESKSENYAQLVRFIFNELQSERENC